MYSRYDGMDESGAVIFLPKTYNPSLIMRKISGKYKLGDIQLDATNLEYCEGHKN